MIKVQLDSLINTTSPANSGIAGFSDIEVLNGLVAQDAIKFWQKQTTGLPTHIKQKLFENFQRTIKKGSPYETKWQRYANEDLRKSVTRFHQFISKDLLWLMDGKDVESQAKTLVNLANTVPVDIELHGYSGRKLEAYKTKLFVIIKKYIEPKLLELGLKPFFKLKAKSATHKFESALVRYMSIDYVLGKFTREAEKLREHIEIVLGNVTKQKAPYCSFKCVNEYKARQQDQAKWLEEMVIVDAENPIENPNDLISLKQAVDSSTSNPVNRRNELMTRMRGLEDVAAKQGMKGLFITITAPSKYHANSKRYNGFTPSQTQKVLVNNWAKMRAKLHRQGVSFFGLRVTEPHGDATPHWHMILFCLEEHEHTLKEVIESYATKEDKAELFNSKGIYDASCRVDCKEIDPAMGSATGYIAKYIAKNIDAAYCFDKTTRTQQVDDETGKPLKDSVAAVLAWSSRWSIRQFQFLGGAPVTHWRECRRYSKDFSLKQSIQEALSNGEYDGAEYLSGLDSILDAADCGNYGVFVQRTGGAFQGRNGRIKTATEKTNNAYGESARKVKGIRFGAFEFVTRDTAWQITTAKSALADLLKRRAASRSADNNCTEFSKLHHSEQLWQDIKNNGSRLQQIRVN